MAAGRSGGPDAPVTLVYDGTCPFCRRAAAWVEAHTPAGSVELMRCADPARAERFPWLSEEDCTRQAYAVGPDGRWAGGEAALLEVLSLAPGWRWAARALRWPLLRAMTPLLYRWFTRNRHALSAFVTGPVDKDREKSKESTTSGCERKR